jgi:hypothetical protein
MAAGNVTVYAHAKLEIADASINLGSDAIFCALLGSGYTPAVNTDTTWANVSANEVTGTGYTSGGNKLTSQSATLSGGTVTFTAGNVSWANSTISARYAVLVRSANGSTVQSTDLLIAYVDLNSPSGPNISTTNGTFQISWNASGIFTLT